MLNCLAKGLFTAKVLSFNKIGEWHKGRFTCQYDFWSKIGKNISSSTSERLLPDKSPASKTGEFLATDQFSLEVFLLEEIDVECALNYRLGGKGDTCLAVLCRC